MYAIRFSLKTFHLILNSPSFIIYSRYLSGNSFAPLGVSLMDGGLAGNSLQNHSPNRSKVQFNHFKCAFNVHPRANFAVRKLRSPDWQLGGIITTAAESYCGVIIIIKEEEEKCKLQIFNHKNFHFKTNYFSTAKVRNSSHLSDTTSLMYIKCNYGNETLQYSVLNEYKYISYIPSSYANPISMLLKLCVCAIVC